MRSSPTCCAVTSAAGMEGPTAPSGRRRSVCTCDAELWTTSRCRAEMSTRSALGGRNGAVLFSPARARYGRGCYDAVMLRRLGAGDRHMAALSGWCQRSSRTAVRPRCSTRRTCARASAKPPSGCSGLSSRRQAAARAATPGHPRGSPTRRAHCAADGDRPDRARTGAGSARPADRDRPTANPRRGRILVDRAGSSEPLDARRWIPGTHVWQMSQP